MRVRALKAAPDTAGLYFLMKGSALHPFEEEKRGNSPLNCKFASLKPSPATKNDLFSEIVPFAVLFCSSVCKPGSVPPRREVTTIYLRGLSPRRFTAFAVRHPVSGLGRADPPCGLTRCCIG